MEMILIFRCFSQKGIGDGRLGIHCICTGHIQSDWIKGCEKAHIRYDGSIVFRMAVAVGADINDQIDMEIGASIDHCFGVFGNL